MSEDIVALMFCFHIHILVYEYFYDNFMNFKNWTLNFSNFFFSPKIVFVPTQFFCLFLDHTRQYSGFILALHLGINPGKALGDHKSCQRFHLD